MRKYIGLFILPLFFAISCNEEQKYLHPLVKTLEVSSINESGAVFKGKIIGNSSGQITDHGFVWDIDSLPKIETGYSKSLGTTNSQFYKTDIGSAFIKGERYFVRAYVVTDDYLIYGETVSFISKGGGDIFLGSFYPKEAAWGDTIFIKQKNISYKKGETKVYFQNVLAGEVSSNDSVLQVCVPNGLHLASSNISVTVSDQKWDLDQPFVLKGMQIDDFFPKTANFGDVITIKGKNFNLNKEYSRIFINGESCDVVNCSSDRLEVLLTDNITNTDQQPCVKIAVGDLNCSIEGKLSINSAVIKSFSPEEVDRSDQLKISGSSFNPTAEYNEVYIGDVKAKVISASPTELITDIPDGVIHGLNNVSVKVANNTTVANNKIFVYEPWRKLSDFPASGRQLAFVYTTETNAYVGGGLTGWFDKRNDCWSYSPENDRWQQKGDVEDSYLIGFRYAGDTYVAEYNKLYKYNEEYDSKVLISVCENLGYSSFVMTFVRDDIAYFVANNYGNGELWTYSFADNTWSEEAKPLYISTHGTFGFVIEEDAYYTNYNNYLVNSIYKFDFEKEEFVKELSCENNDYLKNVYSASVFTLNSEAFIIGGNFRSVDYNRMVKYNPDLNQITEMVQPPFEGRTQAIAFRIEDKGYYGLGQNDGRKLSDFWEFDPTKIKPE